VSEGEPKFSARERGGGRLPQAFPDLFTLQPCAPKPQLTVVDLFLAQN
jgi:hypothetical protein